MAEHGGARQGAGRKKGSTNASKTDIANQLREGGHSEKAINKLLALLDCGDEKVELAAVKIVLEYIYGKPKQQLEVDGELTLDIANELTGRWVKVVEHDK